MLNNLDLDLELKSIQLQNERLWRELVELHKILESTEKK